MRAAILVEPGRIEIQDIPTPEPGPGEVLVRVKSALTCGTDLKAYRRGHRLIPMPGPIGHEYSGVVEEVGDGVERFKPGDEVISPETAPCGDCHYCRRGLANICPTVVETIRWGAFAEYFLMPAHIVSQNMYPKPPNLSHEEAAILEPLACVVYGLMQVDWESADNILIIGAGPIGLLYVMALRAMGAGKVFVSDMRKLRLDLARKLGVDAVIDAASQDVQKEVKDLTDGHGAQVVIECTGQKEVWEESVNFVDKGGTVMLFGGCPGGTRASFDTGRVHYDQIALKGVFHLTPESVRRAYDLLCSGKLAVSDLITDTFPLERVQEALEYMEEGSCVKNAVVP